MTSPDDLADVREQVRARYAGAAATVMAGGVPTCGEPSGQEETGTGAGQYSNTERGEVPGQAVTASLGCGNPVAVAELRDGETVLDLGSGGGLDVLLSARRVGPTSPSPRPTRSPTVCTRPSSAPAAREQPRPVMELS
jgi:arsenite methyltransferase